MKKIVCLVIALLVIVLNGCNSKSDEIDVEEKTTSVETETTTEESTEADSGDVFDKMEKYLNNTFDMSKYTKDEEFKMYGNQVSYSFNDFGVIQSPITDYISFDDGTTLQLFSTTIKDLVDQGYIVKKAGDSDDGNRRLVTLEKDNKMIYPFIQSEDQDIYSAVIRAIYLNSEEDSMGYNYCGLTKQTTFDSVVDTLAYPTSNIYTSTDENRDNCEICLSYYSDDYDLDTNIHFKYNPENSQTTFDQIYINT